MTDKLNEIETRICGALVEKQLTTPEYYPLTLNALVAACNQKTNREPVVAFDEQTVEQTLENLREKNLVYVFYGSTSRVPKYKHMLPNVYELDERETAVVCVLMLRGAQTLGELRERTGRLYEFSGLGEVNETLDALMRRDEPLIAKLERQAGQKEVRYAHLLSGEIPAQSANVSVSPNQSSNNQIDKIEKLEREIETMRDEINSLRQTFDEFRKQFE
ncbi:MAG: YceH family protein [Acidobacteriota bacterium]|nr:YceH family protein [Acidobacteriota bacterium]